MRNVSWFEKRKYWWVPVSWQGWVITAVYIIYIGWAYRRIRAEYASDLYFLNWFAQELLSITILLAGVCWLTSRSKSGKTKHSNNTYH